MSPYMWEFQRWVRGYLMRSHNRQRMTFRNKLWVMLTMLVLQIAAHAYMTFEVGTDG